MKVNVNIPSKEYPYLAVWLGKDAHLTMDGISQINKSHIVLISMVEVNNTDEQCDKMLYVQYLLGGNEVFFTKNEEEYFALPKGYCVELCHKFFLSLNYKIKNNDRKNDYRCVLSH